MPNSATLFVVDTKNIKDGAVNTSKLGAGAVTPQKVTTTYTDGSISIAANTHWIPDAGLWNMAGDAELISFQIYVSGTWYNNFSTTIQGWARFDGTNQRVRNRDTVNHTVYYQRY